MCTALRLLGAPLNCALKTHAHNHHAPELLTLLQLTSKVVGRCLHCCKVHLKCETICAAPPAGAWSHQAPLCCPHNPSRDGVLAGLHGQH